MAGAVYLAIRRHDADHIVKMRSVYLEGECLVSRLEDASEYLASGAGA